MQWDYYYAVCLIINKRYFIEQDIIDIQSKSNQNKQQYI